MASKELFCGVYKITNPIGQTYIGQSKDIYKRWAGYKALHFTSQNSLRESFVKYGVENHLFEIIEVCELRDAVKKERYWVSHFGTYNKENGLNRNKGGGGCVEHTEETKKRIGQHSLGNKYLLGRKLSAERIEQMKQYKMSQETKDKIYPKLLI